MDAAADLMIGSCNLAMNDIELFADLMVRVDDPFAQRDAVFIASGLDEDGYRNLVDTWRTRFDRDPTGSLAARFAEVYDARRAAMLEARRREACGEKDAADLRFLNTDVQSFREQAATVAREPAVEAPPPALPPSQVPLVSPAIAEPITPIAQALPTYAISPPPPPPIAPPTPMMATPPVAARRPAPTLAIRIDRIEDPPGESMPFTPSSTPSLPEASSPPPPRLPTGTADISSIIPRDLFPFPAESSRPPPAPPPPPPPPQSPAPPAMAGLTPPSVRVARPPEHLAATADISAFVPRAATPFVASAPPAPSAPRRRLIRFDPQTGQPLPAPMWVDLPPEPEASKK